MARGGMGVQGARVSSAGALRWKPSQGQANRNRRSRETLYSLTLERRSVGSCVACACASERSTSSACMVSDPPSEMKCLRHVHGGPTLGGATLRCLLFIAKGA